MEDNPFKAARKKAKEDLEGFPKAMKILEELQQNKFVEDQGERLAELLELDIDYLTNDELIKCAADRIEQNDGTLQDMFVDSRGLLSVISDRNKTINKMGNRLLHDTLTHDVISKHMTDRGFDPYNTTLSEVLGSVRKLTRRVVPEESHE